MTGVTNQIHYDGRCNIKSICICEVTGINDHCNYKNIDCPVKRYNRQKKFEICGIHKRFYNCSFESIEKFGIPECIREQYENAKKYANNIEDNLANGRGLMLKGTVGTMKTTLAVAVLQKHIENGGSGLFITMPGLLDSIFTLKAKSNAEWVNFEQRIREIPLLILDDMGAEHTEGWVLTKVDAIIAERYNRCRSVLITTNLSAEQLRGIYAERVIDRLRSTLKVINFNCRSLRRPS